MPTIGFTINNITAKRVSDMPMALSISHRVAITNAEEMDMPALGKKGLKLSFEFGTKYTDDQKKMFGEISITGHIMYIAQNTAQLLTTWKKEKKLPEDVDLECINIVIKKCMGKAIILSEDVGLPSPIPIPFAQKPPEEKGK
jgi:hypothetical protein